MFDDVLDGRLLAAPPRRHRRQLERFAQHPLRDAGQEAQQRSRFDNAGTQGIGHDDPARAHGAQQARHAQCRIGAQFDRIAIVIVEPAQDRVHAPQARQRLQIDGIATHGQVVALDQRQAQVARQIGVFEVGLVERTWREDHGHGRVRPFGRAQQARPQAGEEPAHRSHAQLLTHLGVNAGNDLAVFQGVARTRGRLGAVAQHPPATIRRPRQVHGIEVQPGSIRWSRTATGPKVVGVAEDQLRRNAAVGDQFLRAIEIGQQRIEQVGPLQHARFDLPPLRPRNEEGQRIEHPGSITSLRIGINVVGHAVLDDQPARQLDATPGDIAALGQQARDQRVPVLARLALGIQQLVIAARLDRIGAESLPVQGQFGSARHVSLHASGRG